MSFEPRNAISSKEATAYIRIDGRNYELFYAKDLEATAQKTRKRSERWDGAASGIRPPRGKGKAR